MAAVKKIEARGSGDQAGRVLQRVKAGEVRGARWAEFDLDAALWIIPAERMKMGHEHRVPLSLQSFWVCFALCWNRAREGPPLAQLPRPRARAKFFADWVPVYHGAMGEIKRLHRV